MDQRERIPLAPRQPCIEPRVPLMYPVVTIEQPTSTDTNKSHNNNNNNDDDISVDEKKIECHTKTGKLGSGEYTPRRSCSSRSTCNWDVCSYEATSKSCCSSMASSRSSINSEVFAPSRFVDASVQCQAGSIDRAMNRYYILCPDTENVTFIRARNK